MTISRTFDCTTNSRTVDVQALTIHSTVLLAHQVLSQCDHHTAMERTMILMIIEKHCRNNAKFLRFLWHSLEFE